MYRPDSTAPVAHQDVAAYFSDDEWKLLHDWQQELYSKVINEVHQALISLGPLIATTVSALRSKEMKDGCTVDHQDSDTRRGIGGEGDTNSVVSIWIDQEETTTLKVNPETYIRDHSQVDMTPVVTFQIKEEVETFLCDNQRSGIMDVVNGSKDEENVKAQGNNRESVKCSQWTLPSASSGRNAALPVSGKQIHPGSEIWSKYYLGDMKPAHRESSFVNPSESNSDEEAPMQQSTQTYNACTVNLAKANLSFCVQQKGEPEIFPVRKKGLRQKTGFLRHRDDRPFKCPECGRSFGQKAHLIRHQATHRGDRPFHCTECQKCFSRNEYLIVHQRKHTGEMPYKCFVCTKGFRQKRSLVSHQATHNGTLNQREVTSMTDDLPW